MPADLQRHLRACSVANCRSLSAEIVSRLEASVEGESFGEHGVMVRVLHRRSK
jgi:hypothetical protein